MEFYTVVQFYSDAAPNNQPSYIRHIVLSPKPSIQTGFCPRWSLALANLIASPKGSEYAASSLIRCEEDRQLHMKCKAVFCFPNIGYIPISPFTSFTSQRPVKNHTSVFILLFLSHDKNYTFMAQVLSQKESADVMNTNFPWLGETLRKDFTVKPLYHHT